MAVLHDVDVHTTNNAAIFRYMACSSAISSAILQFFNIQCFYISVTMQHIRLTSQPTGSFKAKWSPTVLLPQL